MSKKIVFMGTPDYATIIFDKLIKNDSYEILALFTQPDKKVGRKQILTPPHIKKYCIDNSIDLPIYQPVSLKNNIEMVDVLKNLNPDFIIVAAYGQILPKEILNIAPCINLHASILPKYRGASPIQESILNDDKYTGVTSMLMEEGLDSGDILGIQYLKLTETMLVDEVFNKLSNIAANLTITTLDNYEKIQAKKQNNSEVSFCKKIKKDDGLVSFKDSRKLYLKYKAYCFWPGIFLQSGLKLKEVELNETTSVNKEGKILNINENFAIIACAKGSIKVSTVQAPSKKAVNITDYLRGKRLAVNDTLI
ncbi:methionyl-tRNA formyltransferase [Malaciobacter marinus]|jgi:methionyl-tRNA formyltransferase|uniref:Methionyl-tRNA formyltransferase n=1 Tax=Malaciobacter marinus TaxID=505249 RepID=A0AB36ZXI5_9BACT|nr:methionyl-tRNA formyltransferase [Malaciobacter marinus]PPK60853.1 methionyl-tRNA formyltransferase [Malaciobacter marinus]